MRIALVSDAWRPQTNGVVTTLSRTLEWLDRLGHVTERITPEGFRTIPCPTYPEIRLALLPGRRIAGLLERFAPEAVHIATEGPLGGAARAWCLRSQLPFTTSYHTQFPQYIRARVPIPESWSYAFLHAFHGPAARVMVATEHIRRELADHGFTNLAIDVVKRSVTGVLDEDLGIAVAGALELDREDCRSYALGFTWEKATQQFIGNLQPRGVEMGAASPDLLSR